MFDRPLDVSARAASRSAAWQKLLVLDQPETRHYERVVWADSDIIINPEAPPITEGVKAGRIGAVEAWSSPSREGYDRAMKVLMAQWPDAVDNPAPEAFYEAYGLPPRLRVVQTGVMVLEPRTHGDLFRFVYDHYDERSGNWNYEMRPLSWEIVTDGRIDWIDWRFNAVWSTVRALHHPEPLTAPSRSKARLTFWPHRMRGATTSALKSVYFLHFAGESNLMDFLDAES